MPTKTMPGTGVLAAVFAVVIAACVAPQNALQVVPQTTADSLVFTLTGPEGSGPAQAWVYGLSVVECDTDHAMWTIASSGATLPSHIVYGRPLPGFEVHEGPKPLVAGCYDVFVSGGKPIRFLVDSTKAVRLPDR